jgi:hypothetical protein
MARPGCSPPIRASRSVETSSRARSPSRRAVTSGSGSRVISSIAAELYLREDPGGIGIVTQHLGHRDANTARIYYAREQSRIATQRYHDVLVCRRAKVGKVPALKAERRERRA